MNQTEVFLNIIKERMRQDKKHAIFVHSEALAVLVEEVGEVARALQEGAGLEEELLQTAAFCIRWLEHLKE